MCPRDVYIDFHGCECCGFELFECIHQANHLMTSNIRVHFASDILFLI
tara:strand:- start:1518 stop:1661 length:144 start_codon:yes stop_codon:yes gene_type:complete